MVLGSLLISDPFPTNAVYPFPVNFEPLRSIIFMHQSFVGIQCAAHASMNVLSALLLLFTTARFEILMTELRNVNDIETLIKSMKKYSTKQPFAVKAQFLTVSGTALLEVLMCSLPADHLIDMSENIMQGIYESKWYERSLKIQKSTVLMLTPQSPVTVKIKCLIPVLSLNFYCSYVSNVFSLFTALRIAMINDETEN
ncbi:PREDICTED: odorant receptor 49a-like [Habropoda laboriosa]|uniref:odorant receptor 49a-like n=1 Tax=Habropoda laboriosa TaxID=597456 RepID=UPI00083D8F0C|nr:PREDICTED: odorant receptor 49a-like [Habropoda laboriosa]